MIVKTIGYEAESGAITFINFTSDESDADVVYCEDGVTKLDLPQDAKSTWWFNNGTLEVKAVE